MILGVSLCDLCLGSRADPCLRGETIPRGADN